MNKKIKIAMVARTDCELIDSLVQYADENGYDFTRIIPSNFDLSRITDMSFVEYLASFEVVYRRSGIPEDLLWLFESELQKRGVTTVNFTGTYPFLNRKSYQMALASYHTVATPKTLLARSVSFSELEKELGIPFIAKPSIGTQGNGVALVSSKEDLETALISRSVKDLLFQSYISSKHEYRVYVIGGKAITGYKKTAKQGEFRANVALGSTVDVIAEEEFAPLANLAEKISQAFKVEIFAADFLRDESDVYLLELNLRPGWVGADMLGYDLRETLLNYLSSVAK